MVEVGGGGMGDCINKRYCGDYEVKWAHLGGVSGSLLKFGLGCGHRIDI